MSNKTNMAKSAWKTRSLTRYADLKEWHGEDYGPVTWEELSTLRRNSVILFNSELHPNKVSEWTLRTDPSREIKYYICVLCRRLQDKGRREVPPIHFGTAARIVVRNGRFLVHPDYPTTPHICGFEENPMSDRAAVLTRRAMIRARTEIGEDGTTPEEKIDEVIARFRSDPKYADLSAEDLSRIETLVRASANTLNVVAGTRSLYLNRRKQMSDSDTPRKVYECPIVGCSFVTCVTAMIDVHISEKHKTADCEANPGVSDGQQRLGVAAFDHDLQPQRLFPLILFRSRRYPGKISEWTQNGMKGEALTHYSCVLCRRLKAKSRRNNLSVDYGPAAGITVRNGRFVIDPDYPSPSHICNFADNPLSDEAEVMRRRSKATVKAHAKTEQKTKKKVMGGGMFFVNKEGEEGGDTEETHSTRSPSDSPNRHSASVDGFSMKEHGFDDDDSNQQTESNKRDVGKMPLKQSDAETNNGKERSRYQCSIVGCSYTTSDMNQLDAHLCDHESLDEVNTFHQMQETTLAHSGRVQGGTESLQAEPLQSEFCSSTQSSCSAGDVDRLVRIRSNNHGEVDFGPVVYEAISGRNHGLVILFNSIRYPGRVSEWLEKYPQGNTDLKSYLCVLCERVRENGGRMRPPKRYPPCARILVRHSRFLTHPDYPLTPHICAFETNPLSLGELVLKRRPYVRERTDQDENEALAMAEFAKSVHEIMNGTASTTNERERLQMVECDRVEVPVDKLAVQNVAENVVIMDQSVVRDGYTQLMQQHSFDTTGSSGLDAAECGQGSEPLQKRAKFVIDQHTRQTPLEQFITAESAFFDEDLSLDDGRPIEELQMDLKDLLKKLNNAIPSLSRAQLQGAMRALVDAMQQPQVNVVLMEPVVEEFGSLNGNLIEQSVVVIPPEYAAEEKVRSEQAVAVKDEPSERAVGQPEGPSR
ncbi:hypothetical protein Tcan_13965 [Toxocara canis]|uniref:C2H2-type domain-containing protein n=2 Tax=Toxocara canis TaxID=6265 RepID=A0A0B2VC01_TOXCA|nr:hypothetical protein Tcan_13965 [Toxocara canis]VDM40038.1 unnamed protein product [Toxocara canis]